MNRSEKISLLTGNLKARLDVFTIHPVAGGFQLSGDGGITTFGVVQHNEEQLEAHLEDWKEKEFRSITARMHLMSDGDLDSEIDRLVLRRLRVGTHDLAHH